MKNIIYSKYSNDRADQFKIRTDIVEDVLVERRFVHKKALTKEAHIHIDNIYRNYELLSKTYEGSKICINKCCKIDTGLEFEYITGNTLEEEFDELLLKKQYGKLIQKIQEYVFIVESGIGKKNFKPTEDFIKVFGHINLSSSLRAGEINNIDLVFNNIIVGEKWNIIDYEWTFNFSIPFNFIIYRAIHYYMYGSSKRSEVINLGLYKLLGITDEELVQYDIMERNFQAYVLGNLVPVRDLYATIAEMNVNVQNVIECERADLYKNTIQVFYDYGEGFNEAQSYKINPSLDSNGKANFEISVTDKVKQVRVDPSNVMCIVNIDSILGYNTKFYSINHYTNGIKLSEKITLFATDDPQIILRDVKSNTTMIELKFEVQVISKEMTIQLCEFLQNREEQSREEDYKIMKLREEIKEKDNTIQEKDNIIQEKDNTIQEKDKLREQIVIIEEKLKNKENYINDIQNSKGWKALCKIKRLLGK